MKNLAARTAVASIIDGGFTRLSCKWDSAGTGRYIRNAASWLAHYERFGDRVVANPFKKR